MSTWVDTSLHSRMTIVLYVTNIQKSKREQQAALGHMKCQREETAWQREVVSVTEIWDVIVGVPPVTLGSVVGYPQMVKSRKENK